MGRIEIGEAGAAAGNVGCEPAQGEGGQAVEQAFEFEGDDDALFLPPGKPASSHFTTGEFFVFGVLAYFDFGL